MDNGQTNFIGLLDAVNYKHYFHQEMDSVKNDCGVFVDNILSYRIGKLTGDYIEVRIAMQGDRCYYDYGYMSHKDNEYGRWSPLDEMSHSFHRNNTAEDVREFIVDTFEHSVLYNDRNVSKPQKKKLLDMMKKLVMEIT